MKILLALEYWNGDRVAAEETIIQAANLLDFRSNIVSLALVHRFDADPFPEETIQFLRDKFWKVIVKKCVRRGQGFPFGCNELSYFTLNWPLHDPELFEDIESILIYESDCVFTRRNWDVEILSEWRKTQAEGKLVCGKILPYGYNRFGSHVNAVSVYSKDIAKFIGSRLSGGPGNIGWDFFHGKNIVPITFDSPIFHLEYRKETITEPELFYQRHEVEPLIFHGVKDNSARKIIDEKYNLRK
jgi:hypothetical protein